MNTQEIIAETKKWVICLILSCAILYVVLLLLPGCAVTPGYPEPTTVVTPVRYISPRCAEVEPEIPEMRAWCNATMIPPSRQREACRMVEDYERDCL